MLRVAFTSCSNIEYCKVQRAWSEIAKRDPHVLVLLGDTVYMNSHAWDHAGLDSSYRRQLDEPNFVALRRRGIPVLATWDDHDFGPNDRWAADEPEAMRRASFELFQKHMHFRTGALPDRLYTSWVTDDVHFIVLDTRLHRENPLRNPQTASLLGKEQEEWLDAELNRTHGVTLLCCSSGLTQGAAGHAVRDFAFYPHLKARLAAKRNVLVLSGDIHRNDFVDHGGFFEAVSSGVGITKSTGRRRYKPDNYGLLHIGPERVDIELHGHDPGRGLITRSIRRADWTRIGSRLTRTRG